ALQRAVYINHFLLNIGWDSQRIVERSTFNVAAAFRGQVPPRVVHEHAAHQFRGNAEKLRAILPSAERVFRHAHYGLVYNGGGLERVMSLLFAHVTPRNAAKLIVNQRD